MVFRNEIGIFFCEVHNFPYILKKLCLKCISSHFRLFFLCYFFYFSFKLYIIKASNRSQTRSVKSCPGNGIIYQQMVMITCVALSFWKHNSILDTISIASLTRGLYQVTAVRRQGMLKLTIYKKHQFHHTTTMRVEQVNISSYIYTLHFY